MTDHSELKRLAKRYDIPDDVIGELELLVTKKLKAENEALRKDAERYRWLRSHEPLTSEFYQGEQCRELRWGKRLDDLIDLALSKESSNG